MRNVRPPPRVVVGSKNGVQAGSNTEPRLADWKKEGFPSEFAYAKALGLLEIKPSNKDVSNAPPEIGGVPYKQSESALAAAEYDYEADVQREMKKLEEGLKLMLIAQEQTAPQNIEYAGDFRYGEGMNKNPPNHYRDDVTEVQITLLLFYCCRIIA